MNQSNQVQSTWGECERRHKLEDEERAATEAEKAEKAESATTAAPAHAVTAHPASTQVLSSTGTQRRCQKQLFMELEQELKPARATLDKLTFKFRDIDCRRLAAGYVCFV